MDLISSYFFFEPTATSTDIKDINLQVYICDWIDGEQKAKQRESNGRPGDDVQDDGGINVEDIIGDQVLHPVLCDGL